MKKGASGESGGATVILEYGRAVAELCAQGMNSKCAIALGTFEYLRPV